MQTINPAGTARTAEGCETISVPEAGRRYFGMSRNASYMAAERGEIPTVRIGRLLRVPVRALERMLDQASQRSAS
jgi:ribosomal protein S14